MEPVIDSWSVTTAPAAGDAIMTVTAAAASADATIRETATATPALEERPLIVQKMIAGPTGRGKRVENHRLRVSSEKWLVVPEL